MDGEVVPPGEAPAEAAPAPAPPDYRDLYLRALAELDNYRKRVDKDRSALAQMAAEAVVRRLLEPLDSFERAIGDLARLKADAPAEFQSALSRSLDGLRALHRQLFEAMASEGVAVVSAQGAEFDPALHEVLAQVPHATAPVGTVVQVLRPGYTLGGRLLRAAAVAVSSGPAAPAAEAPPDDGGTPSHRNAPASGADSAKKT